MQIPQFGATYSTTDKGFNRLFRELGSDKTEELETALREAAETGDLAAFKNMAVTADEETFFRQVEGGLAIVSMPNFNVAVTPTNPKTGEPMDAIKEDVPYNFEEEQLDQNPDKWPEVLKDAVDHVVGKAKEMAAKYKIQ